MQRIKDSESEISAESVNARESSSSFAMKWAKQNTLDLTEMITLKNIHEKVVLSKFAAKNMLEYYCFSVIIIIFQSFNLSIFETFSHRTMRIIFIY